MRLLANTMTVKKLQPYSDVLYEPVQGLQRMRIDAFCDAFDDEVADLDDETLVCTRWRILPGIGEIIELSIGYAVFVDRAECLTLYETEEHYQQRTLHAAWARFVRGTWTSKVPSEPGLYFVRDVDLGRRSVRELRRENGRLLDVSGGLVPPGQVTTWCGAWWSVVTPRLPDSY